MKSWIWDAEQREFVPGSADGELRLADSWFVGNGRVRAFDRHRRRFSETAETMEFPDASSADFWSALIDFIPRSGEWFPRVEILGDNEPVLGLRLRPAPPRTDELSVWIPPFADPRRHPQRKGPDIGLLGKLRDRAQAEQSCDEALLLDEEGFVIESATSSLLWWDGETMCLPHPDLEQLPGVTTALIHDEAQRRSIHIEWRLARPEDLNTNEVWLVNALHGIRRIKTFSGSSESVAGPAPEWFWEWKQWLDAQAEPF